MGELTVSIVFPNVAIRMYRSSPLVQTTVHVSLVHVSACSFAVSQASDLALLVGYVALEDFKLLLLFMVPDAI